MAHPTKGSQVEGPGLAPMPLVVVDHQTTHEAFDSSEPLDRRDPKPRSHVARAKCLWVDRKLCFVLPKDEGTELPPEIPFPHAAFPEEWYENFH